MGCNRCNRTSCRCSTIPLRYTGPDIDCVGVLQNDTFETVVRKLTDYVCDISFEDGVGITNVVFNEGTCTITITLTNGASYETGSLCGEDGVDGVDGQGVDHVSFTSSTGSGQGEPGETDTYTVWGDVAETINLGTFEVYNGTNAPAGGDTVFHKTIDIGSWDMDAINLVTVPHGLNFTKIVSVDVHVYHNDGDALFSLAAGNPGPGSDPAGGWYAGPLNINLFRTSGGYFDSLEYNDAIMNRGKILIHYIP